jgi:hypothetical protein
MNIYPSFYIIGSKYGDGYGRDTIPKIDDFLRLNCVAIGFIGDVDFTNYMGADDEDIVDFVDENWHDEKPAKHIILRYFRLLSELKVGDIIAVKSHGTYNGLTILAYARVTERNGSIYEHNESELGHHIHVDFLETDLYKNVGLTYAGTIHHLTANKDKEKFQKVFGWYGVTSSAKDIVSSDTSGSSSDTLEEEESLPDSDYNEKAEGSFQRGPIAASFVELIHSRIQNKFIKYLRKTYPVENVSGERKYIDAKRENTNTIFIYELKPSTSAYSCIRQAIGQLLDYSHKCRTTKKKKIVVVGPSHPDDNDIAFISSIRSALNLPFSYIAFDEQKMTATEY